MLDPDLDPHPGRKDEEGIPQAPEDRPGDAGTRWCAPLSAWRSRRVERRDAQRQTGPRASVPARCSVTLMRAKPRPALRSTIEA
jgi:hypothetical protein